MGGVISKAFQDNILPIAFDIGRCIFITTTIGGVYVLIRGNQSEAIKKIKNSTIGYIILRMVVAFADLVDKVASQLHF